MADNISQQQFEAIVQALTSAEKQWTQFWHTIEVIQQSIARWTCRDQDEFRLKDAIFLIQSMTECLNDKWNNPRRLALVENALREIGIEVLSTGEAINRPYFNSETTGPQVSVIVGDSIFHIDADLIHKQAIWLGGAKPDGDERRGIYRLLLALDEFIRKEVSQL
jgi:hypothetical protein